MEFIGFSVGILKGVLRDITRIRHQQVVGETLYIRDLVDDYCLVAFPTPVAVPPAVPPCTYDAFRALFVVDASELVKTHFILLEYPVPTGSDEAALLEVARQCFEKLGLRFDLAFVPGHLTAFLYKSGFAKLRNRLALNSLQPSAILRLSMPIRAGGYAAKRAQTDAFLARQRLPFTRCASMGLGP